MNGPHPGAPLVLLASLLFSLAAGPRPTRVEPSELAGRMDLIGREVEVDDRVVYFSSTRTRFRRIGPEGPRRFSTPPALRPKQSPRAPAVRVKGILRAKGPVACDVSALELFPADRERFDRGGPSSRRATPRAGRRGRVGPSGAAANSATPNSWNEPNSWKAKPYGSYPNAARPTPGPMSSSCSPGPGAATSRSPSRRRRRIRVFQAQLKAARTVEELKCFGSGSSPSSPGRGCLKGGDADLARWRPLTPTTRPTPIDRPPSRSARR